MEAKFAWHLLTIVCLSATHVPSSAALSMLSPGTFYWTRPASLRKPAQPTKSPVKTRPKPLTNVYKQIKTVVMTPEMEDAPVLLLQPQIQPSSVTMPRSSTYSRRQTLAPRPADYSRHLQSPERRPAVNDYSRWEPTDQLRPQANPYLFGDLLNVYDSDDPKPRLQTSSFYPDYEPEEVFMGEPGQYPRITGEFERPEDVRTSSQLSAQSPIGLRNGYENVGHSMTSVADYQSRSPSMTAEVDRSPSRFNPWRGKRSVRATSATKDIDSENSGDAQVIYGTEAVRNYKKGKLKATGKQTDNAHGFDYIGGEGSRNATQYLDETEVERTSFGTAFSGHETVAAANKESPEQSGDNQGGNVVDTTTKSSSVPTTSLENWRQKSSDASTENDRSNLLTTKRLHFGFNRESLRLLQARRRVERIYENLNWLRDLIRPRQTPTQGRPSAHSTAEPLNIDGYGSKTTSTPTTTNFRSAALTPAMTAQDIHENKPVTGQISQSLISSINRNMFRKLPRYHTSTKHDNVKSASGQKNGGQSNTESSRDQQTTAHWLNLKMTSSQALPLVQQRPSQADSVVVNDNSSKGNHSKYGTLHNNKSRPVLSKGRNYPTMDDLTRGDKMLNKGVSQTSRPEGKNYKILIPPGLEVVNPENGRYQNNLEMNKTFIQILQYLRSNSPSSSFWNQSNRYQSLPSKSPESSHEQNPVLQKNKNRKADIQKDSHDGDDKRYELGGGQLWFDDPVLPSHEDEDSVQTTSPATARPGQHSTLVTSQLTTWDGLRYEQTTTVDPSDKNKPASRHKDLLLPSASFNNHQKPDKQIKLIKKRSVKNYNPADLPNKKKRFFASWPWALTPWDFRSGRLSHHKLYSRKGVGRRPSSSGEIAVLESMEKRSGSGHATNKVRGSTDAAQELTHNMYAEKQQGYMYNEEQDNDINEAKSPGEGLRPSVGDELTSYKTHQTETSNIKQWTGSANNTEQDQTEKIQNILKRCRLVFTHSLNKAREVEKGTKFIKSVTDLMDDATEIDRLEAAISHKRHVTYRDRASLNVMRNMRADIQDFMVGLTATVAHNHFATEYQHLLNSLASVPPPSKRWSGTATTDGSPGDNDNDTEDPGTRTVHRVKRWSHRLNIHPANTANNTYSQTQKVHRRRALDDYLLDYLSFRQYFHPDPDPITDFHGLNPLPHNTYAFFTPRSRGMKRGTTSLNVGVNSDEDVEHSKFKPVNLVENILYDNTKEPTKDFSTFQENIAQEGSTVIPEKETSPAHLQNGAYNRTDNSQSDTMTAVDHQRVKRQTRSVDKQFYTDNSWDVLRFPLPHRQTRGQELPFLHKTVRQENKSRRGNSKQPLRRAKITTQKMHSRGNGVAAWAPASAERLYKHSVASNVAFNNPVTIPDNVNVHGHYPDKYWTSLDDEDWRNQLNNADKFVTIPLHHVTAFPLSHTSRSNADIPKPTTDHRNEEENVEVKTPEYRLASRYQFKPFVVRKNWLSALSVVEPIGFRDFIREPQT